MLSARSRRVTMAAAPSVARKLRRSSLIIAPWTLPTVPIFHRIWSMNRPLRGSVLGALAALALVIPGAASQRREAAMADGLADGIRLRVRDGFLAIQIKADHIVRVLHSRERLPRVNDLVVIGPTGAER